MKELSISQVQSRSVRGNLEIVGLITNSGSRTWSSVKVEAEFFDAAGMFIDESTENLRSDIRGEAKEHFKVTVMRPGDALVAPETKMVVKIAGGHTFPF